MSHQFDPLFQHISRHLPSLMGWCSEEKAHGLASLICEHRPEIVVELGIYGGKSLIPMAMACHHIQHGKVFGIDPWEAQASLEGSNDPLNDKWWSETDYRGVYKHFVHNVVHHDLLAYCEWFRLTSEKASLLWGDNIGLLHIDGNHSTEKSCQDVDLWLPKLKIGGILCFDDCSWQTTGKAQSMISHCCEKFTMRGDAAFFTKVKKYAPT